MSLGSFFGRVGDNIANAPSESWFTLAQALSEAKRPTQGLALGLAGFGQQANAAKKKASLAEALKGAMGDFTPQQRAFMGALGPDNVEQTVPIVASQIFKEKKDQGGPFPGSGFDSGAANIIVEGQKDPAKRASPEYAIAYTNLTNPKVITDAEGRQVLYRPPIPQGILPPLSGSQMAPRADNAAPRVAPPMAGKPTPPPAGIKPDAPGAFFEPDMHPELYDPSRASPPTPTQVPGGGTTTVIPGTGQKPGEGEVSGIRNQLNTVLPSMNTALNSYEAALNDTSSLQRTLGPLGGAATAKLKTFHTNALLQAKELFNLGVLNGPDYTLMTQMIDDPESVTAALRGSSGLKAQIKAFRSILKQKVDDYNARAKSLGLQGVVPQTADTKSNKPDPLGIR